MNWVTCMGDFTGHNKGPYPTQEGHYRVLISGDSEHDDMGGVIYAFDDYETWAYWAKNEDVKDGGMFHAVHDEDHETILAWYGPIDIPKREK